MDSKLPLLSIVIPIYGTEKYLRKCLDSVLSQTYGNLEIICVNDCSKDNSEKILEEYKEKDERIKVIKHEKNRGLFWARMTGVKAAKGEYLAFIDSDDYISMDWYRPLIERAERDSCDMVLGNYVEQDEKGWRFYSNIPRNLSKTTPILEGEEIYDTFMTGHGTLFYWHVMWNKIYKKSFFDKCMKHYMNMKEGLIMTEDIAFSCVTLFYAQKLALEDNDCYFYCRHAGASTSTTLPAEKIIKNLKDVVFVFDFFKRFLLEKNIYKKYEKDFAEFKAKYFRIWCNSIQCADLLGNKEVIKLLLEGFGQKEVSFVKDYEFHLTSLNTTWNPKFNELKETICNKDIKVVSFDIFDTLIKRPLWNPEDVFIFVQEKVKHLIKGNEENLFIKLRKASEAKCRELNAANNPLSEDVTLTEIYDTMSSFFGVEKNITEKLKQTEIETEKKFLSVRNSGKILFELAKFLGKKIAIVSDMYLEEADIKDILKMNGYEGYDYFYLSSKQRKLKSTGSLFSIVIDDLAKENIKPKEILHIGDTWVNDVVKPREMGVCAQFLPKATTVFNGDFGEVYSGGCSEFLKQNYSNVIDTRKIIGQLPIRTMYAIAANEIFDNPFNSFENSSKYNGNPYIMGYYVLGTYLVGMTNWIYNLAKKNGYDKILFLARDGYFAHKIFEELLKGTKSNLKAEYVYATRKSTLPYVIDEPEMFYAADNFVNIYSPKYTYRKFLELFAPVTNELTPELEKEYRKNGIVLSDKIRNIKNFNAFIKVYLKLSFNKEKLLKQREIVSEYFEDVAKGNCAAFDIGYSGRIQKALSKLCKKPIDALFAHDNGFSTNVMANSEGFKVFNYYDFDPLATDILREVFVSESAPSCVGYEKNKNGKVVPVFGKDKNTNIENFAIDMMQKAALSFAKEYYKNFAEFIDFMPMRNIEAGYAFEHFCLNASEFDKYVFINHTLEDNVYSGTDDIGMVYRWNQNLNEISGNSKVNTITVSRELTREEAIFEAFKGKSKFKKAIYYILCEPKLFFKKVFKKLRKKK